MPSSRLLSFVWAFTLAMFAFTGPVASAADPPKERYYLEVKAITAKPELSPEAVKAASPRVLAEVKKAFEHHPQVVAKLDGAPDPKIDPDAYRSQLDKAHIAGAFGVKIEITDAVEALTPIEDKPLAQRLEIRVALRLLGAHIPDDTLGFTGHGKAAIKQEVGSKLRERERQEAWDQVVELAVSDAVKTALEELAIAAKTKAKQKPKLKSVGKAAAPAAPH